MDLPFELSFIQYNYRITPPFFDDVENLFRAPFEEVRENITLQVLFTSNDVDARLYMDGLELLTQQMIRLDDKGVPYLHPSQMPYTIFESGENKDEYYPLIPADYQMMVKTGEREWYSGYKVKPKEMSEDQLELMKVELEQELRGLAQDLVRKHLTVSNSGALSNIPSKILYQFLVMVRNFNNMISALSDIAEKPMHKIRREYQIVTEDKAKFIDPASLRMEETIPLQDGWAVCPKRMFEYDLPENRFLMKMVTYISKVLKDVGSSIDVSLLAVDIQIKEMAKFQKNEAGTAHFRERKRVYSDLLCYGSMAKKMSRSLATVLNAPWKEEVNVFTNAHMTPTIRYDSRYRQIHQIYRELKDETTEITFDSSYSYQWKRTDWLYEMWGFVKVCKFLRENIEFEAESGWIFEVNSDAETVFVPVLKPETVISFVKGDVTIKAVYNAEMPYDQKLTSRDVPLYVVNTRHNKPDLRLDVYVRGVYYGSLLIDFKYRPKRWIWNVHADPSDNTILTNRLMAYFSGPTSKYILDDRKSLSARRGIRPAREVWAFYPGYASKVQKDELMENEIVRLVTLCPGASFDHAIKALAKGIHDVIEFGDEI